MSSKLTNKQNALRYVFVAFLFLSSTSFLAAQIQLNGRVVDGKNEPLVGATILVKGTTNGTVTDIDGTYNLTVSDANSVLQISYTGFLTKEEPVNGRNNINITLSEDAELLDEVVVVGYGAQKKACGNGCYFYFG